MKVYPSAILENSPYIEKEKRVEENWKYTTIEQNNIEILLCFEGYFINDKGPVEGGDEPTLLGFEGIKLWHDSQSSNQWNSSIQHFLPAPIYIKFVRDETSLSAIKDAILKYLLKHQDTMLMLLSGIKTDELRTVPKAHSPPTTRAVYEATVSSITFRSFVGPGGGVMQLQQNANIIAKFAKVYFRYDWVLHTKISWDGRYVLPSLSFLPSVLPSFLPCPSFLPF